MSTKVKKSKQYWVYDIDWLLHRTMKTTGMPISTSTLISPPLTVEMEAAVANSSGTAVALVEEAPSAAKAMTQNSPGQYGPRSG